MSASHALISNVVLCSTAYVISCTKIQNVHTMIMSIFSVETSSETKYVIWDECGEHLEAQCGAYVGEVEEMVCVVSVGVTEGA